MGAATVVISEGRSLEVAIALHRADPSVMVVLEPEPALSAAARDGWEIGVLTVLLGEGISETSIVGADQRRVRRVQVVLDALTAARPSSARTVTS